LDSISTIFRDQFQIFTSLEERLLIQTISKAVSVRAARLSAAGIVAILRKIGKTKSVAQGINEHETKQTNKQTIITNNHNKQTIITSKQT